MDNSKRTITLIGKPYDIETLIPDDWPDNAMEALSVCMFRDIFYIMHPDYSARRYINGKWEHIKTDDPVQCEIGYKL